jgi:uncharacterized Ntn-hydrolase superfamily protein
MGRGVRPGAKGRGRIGGAGGGGLVLPRPVLAAVAGVFVALALWAAPASATWTVLAIDRSTGQVVIASATCVSQGALRNFPSEGLWDVQAVVVPGRGVAAAQAAVDRSRENQMLLHRELQAGTDPEAILEQLRTDPAIERRQFGILDLEGRALTFSGQENGSVALGVTEAMEGPDGASIHFAVFGNILASEAVVHEGARAFREAEGSLTDRVMAAMVAADLEGGDRRCGCDTEPVPEAACSHRTAHVAYILAADPDDAVKPEGHNRGDWSLFLHATDENIEPHEDANPVTTLQMRYQAWREDPTG